MRQVTLNLIESANKVLEEENPMTLRQVYYQLVSAHIIDNTRNQYQRLSATLVKARQQGMIPWQWIEDRTRIPRSPAMWTDLKHFLNTLHRSYRLDVWQSQPGLVEVWLEKDALSGIFEPITNSYGVTLVVGRGYNSWSALKDAADRLDDNSVILYFGDFDPSGVDIPRALAESLASLNCFPTVTRVALTKEDIKDYNLPPDFTKKSDSRSKAFIAEYGDMAVELDALPLSALKDKIIESIEENLDLSALEEIREQEQADQTELIFILDRIDNA